MAIQFQHLEQANGVTKLASHRIRVLDIDNSRLSGLSPEDIAREYHLPLGAVYEALAYASDHTDEIARLRQTEDQVLERLRAADQRGHGTHLPR